MKFTVKRMLALVLALLLAVPSFAFAEEPVIQSELVDEIIDSTELDFVGDDENPGFDVEFTDVDGDTVIDDGEDIDLSDEDEDMPSDDGDFLEDDDISIDDTDDSASGTGADASGTDPEMIGEDVDSSDGEEAVTPMDAEAEEPAPADTPAEGGETSVEDDAVPADADTPAEGGEASVENDAVPADVDTPTEGGEVSAESDSAPAEDDAAPAEDDAAPDQDDLRSAAEDDTDYIIEASGASEMIAASEATGSALFETEPTTYYQILNGGVGDGAPGTEKHIDYQAYSGDTAVNSAQENTPIVVKFVAGSEIELTFFKAYRFQGETPTYGPEETEIQLTKVNDTYTFNMPAANVRFSAGYKTKGAYQILTGGNTYGNSGGGEYNAAKSIETKAYVNNQIVSEAKEGDTVTLRLTVGSEVEFLGITACQYEGENPDYSNDNTVVALTKVSDNEYNFTMPAAKVFFKVKGRNKGDDGSESGSQGGNGGQGGEPRHFTTGVHKVTVSDSEHGSIQVTTEGMIADTANAGFWLNIEAYPANGYVLGGVTAIYNDESHPVKYQYYNYDHTWHIEFTMPDADVTFNATFVEAGGHSINIDQSIQNGTVATNLATAVRGTTVAVCGVPDHNYELDSVTVTDQDNNPVTLTGNNTFTMPDGAVTVSATFVSSDTVPHDIEIHIQGEGTVSADQTSNIMSGTPVTLTVTPNDGYKLQSLYAYDRYDEEVTVSENNTFTMPACEVSVHASFVTVDTHTINYQPNLEHGYIYGPETAKKGDEVTLTFWPVTGYKLGELTVTGPNGSTVTVTDNTFTMPEGDVTVSATFVEESVPATRYSIGINDSIANGIVTAKVNGVAVDTAAEDDEVTLAVTPNEGYELAQDGLHVYQNGNEVPLTNNTFTMPASNVTITATFKAIKYSVTIDSSLQNGTLTVDKTTAAYGETVTLTATPADGYELAEDPYRFSIDGETGSGSLGPSNGNKLTMPAGNVTVSVIFVKKNYEIHYGDMEYGSVGAKLNGESAYYVTWGETLTLVVEPYEGYELDTLTVTDSNGKEVTVTDNSFTMPKQEVTISATFRPIDYAINVSPVTNGSVIAQQKGVQVETAHYLDTVYLNVTPADGYELESLTVAGPNGNVSYSETNGVYDFSMPAGNVTVSVVFSAIQPEPQENLLQVYNDTPDWGSVAVKIGGEAVAPRDGGTYTTFFPIPDNSQVSIVFTPNEGCSLIPGRDISIYPGEAYGEGWSDTYTQDNPFTYTFGYAAGGTMPNVSVRFEAPANTVVIEPMSYPDGGTITVKVGDAEPVAAQSGQSFEAETDAEITVTAVPNEGYRLLSGGIYAFHAGENGTRNDIRAFDPDGQRVYGSGETVSHTFTKTDSVDYVWVCFEPVTNYTVQVKKEDETVVGEYTLDDNADRFTIKEGNYNFIFPSDLHPFGTLADGQVEYYYDKFNNPMGPAGATSPVTEAVSTYYIKVSTQGSGGPGGPVDPSVDGYALYGGTSGNFNMGDMSDAVKFLVEGQEVSRAKEGEEVTVQINAQWHLVQLVCVYGDITNYLDLESPTFTMPESDVVVNAKFSQQPPHTGDFKFIYNSSHGCTVIAMVNNVETLSANANEYVSLSVSTPWEWIFEGNVEVKYGETVLNLSGYQGFTMPAHDVTITPILSPAHTGQYSIRMTGGGMQGGGNAYVDNVRAASADVGETVELRINANMGYKVTGATLSYNGTTKKLTADNMTFTMPAGDVDVTLEFASDGIIVNDENFPDKNLQKALKQPGYNGQPQFNGHMEDSDYVISAGSVYQLSLENVTNFTGLDQFPKLNMLWISGNDFTTLALENNIVTYIALSNCENLTSVNLSGCPNLQVLNFEWNTPKISSLNVSGCTKLTSLQARGAALKTLDVSHNTELTHLDCNSNQLTTLDVSKNTKLESLSCFSNNITQLNLANNPEIQKYVDDQNKRNINDEEEGYTCIAYVNPDAEEWDPWVLAHDPGVQVSLAPMFDIVKAYADEGEPRGTIEAPSAAPAGRTVTVTVVPNEGYALQGIEVTDDTDDIQITDVSEGVYTFTMPEGEVTITARFIPTLVITAPEAIPDLVYNGQAQALVTAAVTNGGTLQYSLDGENWGETIPTGTDVGSYNVYYQVIDSDGYYGDGTGAEPIAVEIARKPVNVTAASKSKTYGATDPELTYTPDGLIGADTLTGALGREEGEDVGEYAITQGTLSAGNNYEIILNDATLTITRKALTVTAEDKTKVYGDTDPELTWTTQDLVGEDTLTGTLTRVAGEDVQEGGYAIERGTLAATDNYEMTFVPGKLTINKKALTVTAEDKTKVYGEDDPELTWTAPGLVGDDTLTGTLTRVEGENVQEGGYAIERGTLAATANYDMTFVPGTLTINKKALTVTAMPRTKVYGESDPKLTYTVTGLVGDDKVSGELERVAGENVQEGGYAIGQGTLTAGGNYEITYTPSTLTITPAALTVTPDALSKTYGDDDPEVLSYTAVGLANGDTKDTALSGELERATGDNAGEYAIMQGMLAATANYNLTFTDGVKFTIRPKKVTAVAKATSKTYGEKDPDLTYTVADGQLVGSDKQAEVLTGSLTRAAGENVGSYAITKGTLKSASDNYELVFQTARLTINKKELVVTADNKTKTYGDADPTLTWTARDLVEGDALTGALTRVEGENVKEGGYAIERGTLAAGDNYTMVFNPGKLTVKQRKLTVTPDAVEKTYGETDPALTYTVAGELVGADALTGALTRAEGETAGTYAIAQGTLSAGDNYDIELGAAALTINRRPLTITIDAKAKLLNATTEPDLTYTVTGLAAGDEATIKLTRDSGETVGAYPISLASCAIKKGDSDVTESYDVTCNDDAKLTIGNNVINVTAKAAAKTYGAKDPELEYAAAIPEGGALTGALGRVQGEDAGTYAITQGTLQPNAGYVLNFVGANLTIEKAALTVTPDEAEKTYGEADPELTYKVDGLVNGDAVEAVLTGALGRETGENVGTYAIAQGTLAANNNYTLTVTTGKALTIAAKALTVTAKDAEKTYGDADPAFDYDVDGLVNGDTKEAVLTGTLARDEGVDVNEAGYAITQGTLQSRSDNYTVDTFVPAKLVINKKYITVKVTTRAESGLSKAYGDNDPAFEYVDTEGKLVVGDTLTISREAGKKVGVYAFTADNANYNVAFKDGESEQRFEITPKPLTGLTWSTEGLVYNGSGLKPTATVIGNDLEEGDTCYVNVNAVEINGQDGKATVIDAVDAGDYIAEAASLTNPNYKLPENKTDITRHTFTISKASGEAQTVAREVTVSFHGVKDGRVDLTNYLKDATAWSVVSRGDLITAAAPEGNALVYSTMDTEGTEISTGSVVINVQSKNYDDSTLTVNFRTSTAFALRFESNGGPQEASRSLAAGDKIKDYLPAAAERDGYELKGWYLDAALTDPVSEYNAMGESDATVYAKWAPITYTIQLTDPDGYHSDEDILNPITYTVATDPSTPSLTLPILKDNKSGSLSFTFIGWKELGEAEDVEPRLDVTIDPASMVNTTYVAQWKQGEVAGKVAFENAGGGSGLQGVQGLDSKNEASTDDDAPTTSLANAMKAIANENMTEETADSKITVEMNISASSKDAEAKAAIKEAVAPPQAEGVTQSTDFMEITITSETTMAAEEPTEAPVVLDQRTVSDAGRVVEIPLKYDMTGRYNPVITRHHRDENGTSVTPLRRLTRRPSGSEMKDGTFYIEGSGANATVYVYSQLFSTLGMTYDDSGELQVYFDYNNGTAPQEVVVRENEKLQRPEEDPVREGNETYAYVFDKWYADPACKTPYNFDAPVTRNNMTVYAGWKRYAIVDVTVEGFTGRYDKAEHNVTVKIENDNPDIDVYFGEAELTKENYKDGSMTVQSEMMPTEKTYHWYAEATDCVANPASGVVTINVQKLPSAVTTAPRAQSLTYNGGAQALVSAGKASGGTLKYALGTSASSAPASGWSTSVPTAVNAGTYYVWYKVEGTSVYADVKPACVTVTVSAPAAQAAPQAATPQPEPIPTIPVLKKSVKKTISAAPGSVYQIELGGKTGKSFKSSKKKVATVSATGLITVKAAGKTKITLKVGKKKRTLILKVKDPTVPTRIALNAPGGTAVKVGESQTLTVTLPEGTNSGIKWKSSNKKIATVNAQGVVTFKKAGKVTITATAVRGKKKAKVKFKVSK